MSDWAQYYTPPDQSALLMHQLDATCDRNSISTVVDLGAGQGDLLAAAYGRWPTAQLLGVDIDRCNVDAIQQRLPAARCVKADALKFDLPKRLMLEEGSIDLAVANPPYGQLEVNAHALKVLKQVGLDDAVSEKRIRREVVFLAQNLRLLRHGGALVAIVPQGLGTATHFAQLRAALMQRHGLYKAVELPTRTFAGTEARTLALYMVKGGCSTELECVSESGQVHCLNAAQVRDRIGSRYHERAAGLSATLQGMGASICRGSVTHQDARDLCQSFFHTTQFQLFPDGLAVLPPSVCGQGYVTVQTGDILMARVGSRCVGKVAIVQSGCALLTDCVYRIRVEPRFRQKVFQALRSEKGQQWLASVAHGTCALLISKVDLLQFPVE